MSDHATLEPTPSQRKEWALKATMIARYGSVTACAAALGVSQTYVSNTISGADPSWKIVGLLMAHLGLKPDDFPRLPEVTPRQKQDPAPAA